MTGTQNGTLVLWDLRFGLRMRSWKVGTSLTTGAISIYRLAVYPTSPKRGHVIVTLTAKPKVVPSTSSAKASSTDDVVITEVWDISQMTLVETFVASDGNAISSLDEAERTSLAPSVQNSVQTELKTPADAIAAFIHAHQEPQDAKGVAGSSVAHLDRTGPSSLPSSSSSPSRRSISSRPSDTEIRTVRSLNVSETDEDDGDDVFMHPDGEDNITASKGKKRRRIVRDVRALISGVDFGVCGQSNPIRNFSGEGYGGDMNLTGRNPSGEDQRGFVITGSADRMITFWDLKGGNGRSFVISGLEASAEAPVFRSAELLT